MASINICFVKSEQGREREREREKKRKTERGFIFVFYVNFNTLIFLLIMTDIQNLWS